MNRVFFITGTLLIILGVLLFTPIAQHWGTTYYEGTEVFNTEREYILFKQALVDSRASVERLSILSSEPPIIVTFDISVDSSFIFLYGDKRGTSTTLGGFLISFGVFAYALGIWVKKSGRWD